MWWLFLASALAADTWSDPLPGVRLLYRTASGPQRIHALVIDTCAAGIRFRATDSDERRRTTSSFASLVGAEAAVNGDFFSYDDYDVDGLAVGDGNPWSGVYSREGSLAFGQDRTEIVAPGVLSAALPWMEEVVSGKPLLVDGGIAQTGFGTWSACDSRNPRTIYALSQDRRTVWLVVVDGRSSSAVGMTCDEEAALMASLGVDRALNMDGGGSSTMWVAGEGVVNNPSDGSERVVGNHLAIMATGSGPPESCDLWQDLPYAHAAMVDDAGTDLDGDGYADLCARAAAGIRCYHALPAGGWGNHLQTSLLTNADGWNAEARYASIRFGDVTGDGRADMCARDADGVLCWPSLGSSADGTPSGFGDPFRGPALRDADGWSAPRHGGTLRLAELDGDGILDLCARSSTGLRCWRGTGAGFDAGFDGPLLSDASGWTAPSWNGTIRFGDVTGDGRDDLCARASDGVTCWPSLGAGFGEAMSGPAWTDAAGWADTNAWGTIRLVDLDGDGRMDLCGRNASGLDCRLSTGAGFGDAILLSSVTDERGWGDTDNALTFRFGDLDADGDSDVCARGNWRMYCWRYEDGAFSGSLEGPELSNDADWDLNGTWPTLALLDVNGDGRADLVGRGPAGVDFWASNGVGFEAAQSGPRFADGSNWDEEMYWSTLRVVPTRRRNACVAVDTGAVDSGVADTGTDTATDSATPQDTASPDVPLDTATGGAGVLPGKARIVPESCGCATTGNAGAMPSVISVAAAWWTRRRLRRSPGSQRRT